MQTFPETAREYIAFAERAVSQFSSSQNIDDLFTAILATAHTFDFFHRESKGRPTEEADKQAFGAENPDWKTIRQLCNGGVKARLTSVSKPALGPCAESSVPDQPVWIVPFEENEQPVDMLCSRFLARLKGQLSARSLVDLDVSASHIDDHER
ncbi:hypothetical protein GGD66_006916 [Bradyrhizobium sp. CIR48]|uniref:hypothetical protein n=1 Tax=Bradyrhizobium sp. CIR48 TaxID=2663840 RepID=UPI001606618C|nr:hypothetical protein [Bradyrhizobium sp. CIR48]MBB4428329.1 hypothetical protein [Bradyrhizobium sp. CIR48]